MTTTSFINVFFPLNADTINEKNRQKHCQLSQKSINRNTNTKQGNIDL